MSAAIEVEIKGLSEIKKSFSKAPALFTKIFDPAIKKSIFIFLGATRPFVPVDTGFLRETGMQTTFEALTGRLDNVAPYAVFVHEGTKKMAGRPFFEQGIEVGQDQVQQTFDEALQAFNDSL